MERDWRAWNGGRGEKARSEEDFIEGGGDARHASATRESKSNLNGSGQMTASASQLSFQPLAFLPSKHPVVTRSSNLFHPRPRRFYCLLPRPFRRRENHPSPINHRTSLHRSGPDQSPIGRAVHEHLAAGLSLLVPGKHSTYLHPQSRSCPTLPFTPGSVFVCDANLRPNREQTLF